MSIIQEALKKAQKKSVALETVKKEPVRQEVPQEISPHIEKPVSEIKFEPAASSFNSRFAIYGLVLACAATILFIKYHPSKSVTHINAKAASAVDNLKDPVETVTAVPVPAMIRSQNIEPVKEITQSLWRETLSQGDFKLSGIMDLESGKQAIINNLVVIEGDSIGDVRVETITANSVILKKGQSSLTLQLK